MKDIFPFWNYHVYRWFFLPRTFIRHPGVALAWGKYQNYSDNGYVHIPGTALDINPFVGSAMGTTFGLARQDFKSYYESLGTVGEALDFWQRRGFFPGIHIMLPTVALAPLFSGRPPELGQILPSAGNLTLDLIVASPIKAISEAGKRLQDKLFHDNFKDYYIATEATAIQAEAEGKLIGGQSGIDLWNKLQDNQKLTDEEQLIWDEATKRAALYGVLRTQFPQFRLREEEYLSAYKDIELIIEQQLGITAEMQDYLWKHNMKPTDIVGGLPLKLQTAMNNMWQWKLWLGRGQILMPPTISDMYAKISKYWNKVEGFQTERMTNQATTDSGFLTPTGSNHYSGSEWRAQYASNWTTYVNKVDSIETDPEFADAIKAMTPEGQIELAKTLGYSTPISNPMEEAINIYFNIELEKTVDPYTGEESDDYLKFWLEREAVRDALTETQREEFDTYISRYSTPMEKLYKDVTNQYLRGYRAISRILLEGYSEEQKALIAEYYADGTSRARVAQIQETIGPDGNKLISGWTSSLTDARVRLRTASPKLEFWLYVFGYIDKPKTTAAQSMVDAWERDKSSILIGY
jgi:hypothetical protein